MADKRITDSSIPFADNIADNDVIHVVDVSDTTDNAEGTSKRGLFSLIKSTLRTYFDNFYPRLSGINNFSATNSFGSLVTFSSAIFTNGISNNNKKITQVADGVNPLDAVNKSQLDAVSGFDPSSDYTIGGFWEFEDSPAFNSGADLANNNIINLLDPINPQDAATKNYVDTVAVKKHTETIGDGTTTSFNINHGLGTSSLANILVRNISGGNLEVYDTLTIVDDNNITITFAVAPTTNQFEVITSG